jgi:quercetin dioxygenase-like cupin family protein
MMRAGRAPRGSIGSDFTEEETKMKKRNLTIAAALVAVLGAGVGVLNAQQPGFTRTVLQDRDLTAQGRHAVVARAEFVPGGAAGRHTHPGEELGYVVEGTLQLLVEGKPPVTLKQGEVFFVPAGVVHDGKNVGQGKAVVLATYVVEKGKPVATAVK